MAVYWVDVLLRGRWAGFRGLTLSTILSALTGLLLYLVLTYVFRVEEVRKGIAWGIGKLRQGR